MFVGDHSFLCREWYVFFVWELAEEFIEILKEMLGAGNMKQLSAVV